MIKMEDRNGKHAPLTRKIKRLFVPANGVYEHKCRRDDSSIKNNVRARKFNTDGCLIPKINNLLFYYRWTDIGKAWKQNNHTF